MARNNTFIAPRSRRWSRELERLGRDCISTRHATLITVNSVPIEMPMNGPRILGAGTMLAIAAVK
jgi:hypothetical protein